MICDRDPVPQSSNRKIANAYPVALSEEGSSLASRLNSAKSLGYTDICFYLDGADCSLLYNSDVAIALGKHTQNSDLRSLSSISNLFDTNGLYSIAITCMSDFSSENELIRTAAIGYNSVRIAEALRGGIDEVMIYVGDIPAERYYELIRVADEVKRLSTDGKIGIVLTPDLIENSSDMEVKELIYQLSLKFDHLAVDLSVVYGDAEVTNMGEYIDSELGKMLLYVLQYNMRVLVPNTDDAALSSAIRSALESRSINNVQMMP